MRVLNDFVCTLCGTREEHFLENDTTSTDCLSCGGVAKKAIGTPNFKLPYTDPAGFPTEHAKWAKKRERQIAHEKTSSFYEG